MNQNINYPINEFTKTIEYKVNSFSIIKLDIEPYIKANIIISLFFNSTFTMNQKLIMEGDDYTNWSGDDTYLIDWIKSQLN